MTGDRNTGPRPDGGGPADLAGRIRVVLERSGGILGRPVRRGLDTAQLPADQAATLRSLAASVTTEPAGPPAPVDPAGPASRGGAVGPAGADRFVYVIEVEYPGGRVERTFHEPVPDGVRPLLTLLSRAPRLPARPG
ncbi:protealysin inhibitor emfourin [Parafrankia discariae]|uniref:protealysin inhibitor emfourin n=1 Tax=Parafrankia discariae TaxID=365528 RepID=UPI0003681C71|nr:protealysin inhibitor emfourin [Parafrankia discariae]